MNKSALLLHSVHGSARYVNSPAVGSFPLEAATALNPRETGIQVESGWGGGFIGPDASMIFGYENPYCVPFIDIGGFMSLSVRENVVTLIDRSSESDDFITAPHQHGRLDHRSRPSHSRVP